MPQKGSVHKSATPLQRMFVLAETAKTPTAHRRHLPKTVSKRRAGVSQDCPSARLSHEKDLGQATEEIEALLPEKVIHKVIHNGQWSRYALNRAI